MVLTPLQRFYTGISEESSIPTYKLYLDKFFKWAKISHEEFVELDSKNQEIKLEEYIFHLRGITEKTGKYQNSYNTIIAPLKLFCVMNDVLVNWSRLYKMFPKTVRLSNQGAYDDEDIKSLIDHCDNLRDISFIHFMASTAVRIGEVYLLNIKDIEPFEEGAIVTYYAGQKQEYKVCLTPEAYSYLKKYLQTRVNQRPDAPLFVNKKGVMERRLKKSTVIELMKNLRYKSNPNYEKDGKRKHKAPNNAFRKRLENIFADADVQFRYASYLLDHNKSKQDPHYFRDISNERLWAQFKKAIPLITLDKSEKLKFENGIKDKKIVEYETKLNDELESVKAEQFRQNNILKETRFQYLNCWVNDPTSLELDEIEEYNKLIRELGIERCKKIASDTDSVLEITKIRLDIWNSKYGMYWNLPESEFNIFLKNRKKYHENHVKEIKKNIPKKELKRLGIE